MRFYMPKSNTFKSNLTMLVLHFWPKTANIIIDLTKKSDFLKNRPFENVGV